MDKDAIEKLLWVYSIEDDPKEKARLTSEIDSILGIFTPRLIFSKKPVLAVPDKEEIERGIPVGIILQGEAEMYPFDLRIQDLWNHIVSAAAPSHGKSTLIANTKDQLTRSDIRWCSIDSKSDYAGLVKVHPEILVADAYSDLRLNIWEAPLGVEPKIWRSLVIDALAHIGGWGHGVKGYIQKAVDVIVSERGDDFHTGHVYEVVKGWSESSRVSMTT